MAATSDIPISRPVGRHPDSYSKSQLRWWHTGPDATTPLCCRGSYPRAVCPSLRPVVTPPLRRAFPLRPA
jgi:hypothetical protein